MYVGGGWNAVEDGRELETTQILCVTCATVQAGESCLNASGRRVSSDKPQPCARKQPLI